LNRKSTKVIFGFKVNQDQGVLIVDVGSNSQQRGGLRPGDIITGAKGVQIQNADQVEDQLEATPFRNTLSTSLTAII